MKLYHVTSTSSISSILRKGLLPSSVSSTSRIAQEVHTKGVFFFSSIKQLRDELGLDLECQVIDSSKCSLLEVSLPSTFPIKYFNEYGNSTFNSVYTTRKIPAKYIKNLGSLSRYKRK